MYLVIRIHWRYQGKSGYAFDSFGFPDHEDGSNWLRDDPDWWEHVRYWYEDGNGGCDCNRSQIVRVIDSDVRWPCGHTITFDEIVPATPPIERIEEISLAAYGQPYYCGIGLGYHSKSINSHLRAVSVSEAA